MLDAPNGLESFMRLCRGILIASIVSILTVQVVAAPSAAEPPSKGKRVNSPNRKALIHRFTMELREVRSHFLGVELVQIPTDNWTMQEIISEIDPDFIIETGTYKGGSALYYASVLDALTKDGKVITVDVVMQHEKAASFDLFRRRVQFIDGDSVAAETIEKISTSVKPEHTVIVTLDSLHNPVHVGKELELYSKFVSVGSYIIVQDMFYGGMPQAVGEVLKKHPNFERDSARERYLSPSIAAVF
jgi:cephalosporin hydroxylase